MLEVARRLNLGMSYYYKTKVVKRVKDLYTDSPIDVALLDVNESDDLTFVVTVSPDSLYVLETSDGEEVKGRLRDTVSTPLGRVCVQPTWALRDLYYDNPIQVKHRNIYDVVADYRQRVSITRNGSAEWIIDLLLKDTSPQRAADILNEMVAVYNDHTIREKTEIIRQTSDYINTRVAQLDNELGVQEAKIASFKRENQLLNVEEYGQAYIAASIESSEEVERLRAQISHAQYLQTLTSPSEEYRLFPITVDNRLVGAEDPGRGRRRSARRFKDSERPGRASISRQHRPGAGYQGRLVSFAAFQARGIAYQPAFHRRKR